MPRGVYVRTEYHLAILDRARDKSNEALRGKPAWNKGLTVDSNRSLKEMSLKKKGKTLTEEHKKNISKKLIGITRSNETIEKIRNSVLGDKNPAKRPEVREKMRLAKTGENNPAKTLSAREKIRQARSMQILPLKNTKPELIAQQSLSGLGIDFETHKSIRLSDGTFHQVDIYIEPNICIEIDGNYWHNRPDAKIRDVFINQDLKKQGFIIYRIWESEIGSNAWGDNPEIV